MVEMPVPSWLPQLQNTLLTCSICGSKGRVSKWMAQTDEGKPIEHVCKSCHKGLLRLIEMETKDDVPA